MAIKTFKRVMEGSGVHITACRELSLLRELNHPNVLNLQRVYCDPADGSLFMLFDYAEYDLLSMIKHHREALRDKRMSEVRRARSK